MCLIVTKAAGDMLTTRASIIRFLAMSVLAAGSFGVARSQVCHDGVWDPQEYCGRDAYLVTGDPDMNHDCVIDLLDLGLMVAAEGLTGGNLSADINGDGLVSLPDIATLTYALDDDPEVAPCAPFGELPEGCGATLSLSFDPSTVVSRKQGLSYGPVYVYLIADGLQDAQVIHAALEYSQHLQLLSAISPIGWTEYLGDGPDRYWAGDPISGTATIAEFLFFFDGADDAAWIQVGEENANGVRGIRWADAELDQRIDFVATRNLAVRIPEPAGLSACMPANQVPELSNVSIRDDDYVTIGGPGPTVVSIYTTSYTVTGQAGDADGTVTVVEYRVDNGPWQTATGTESWSATIDLNVGANWFQVRAGDDTGAFSPTHAGTITRASTADPQLYGPVGGQTVATATVEFEWQNVGADSYILEVDDDPSFASPEVTPLSANFQGIVDCEKIIGGSWLPAGTWSWRVTALFPDKSRLMSETATFDYAPPELAEPDWDPLYRLYHPTLKDHFYCGNLDHQAGAQGVGYREEGVEGHISYHPFADPAMTPIYRLLQIDTDAHLYTTSSTARNDSIQFSNYLYEGITGYAYATPQPDQRLVPLYHLQRLHDEPEIRLDNFYTTSDYERQNAVAAYGFVDRGVLAYVSPVGDMEAMAWNRIAMAAGHGVSLDNGNFKHHTSAGFSIPGIGLPLDFSHEYNSRSLYYPDQLRSMGPGWRHTYSSFVSEVEDLLIVSWANGVEHVYDATADTCLVPGVYHTLTRETIDRVRITRKDQVSFLFERPVADSPFLLMEIRDRNDNTVTCTYESSEPRRLLTVTGPAGRQLQLDYRTEPDMESLLETVTDPAGRQIHFAYTDSTRDLYSYTDPENHTTYYAYVDSVPHEHQLSRISLPDGTTIDCAYENRRLRSQQWSGQTGGMDLAFNGDQTLVNYTGSTRTYSVDYLEPSTPFATRRPEAVTVGTATTDFAYNDPAHPTLPTDLTDARGNTHSFAYDTAGNLLYESHPLAVHYIYTYDAMNNLTSVTDALTHQTTYDYDTAGNLVTVTRPEGHVTTFGRGAGGLLSSVTTDVGTTSLDYDAFGNLTTITDPLLHHTDFTVDIVGRVSEENDANGNSRYFLVDDRGLITQITDEEGGIATLSYDPNGQLTAVNGPGSTASSWSYRGGFLRSRQTPSSFTSYTYHPDGMLQTCTRGPHSVSYAYDEAGRLAGVNGSRPVGFERDAAGNLTEVFDTQCHLGFTYDELNRLRTATDPWDNVVEFAYDEAGNTRQITYPGGFVVQYHYDDDNRLSVLGDAGGGATGYTYHPDGRVASIVRINNATTTYSYDGAGRLDGIVHSNSQGVIASYDFTLDGMGNQLTRTVVEPLGQPEFVGKAASYSYNTQHQLTADGACSYSYDGVGNLVTITGARSLALDYDDEGRLTSFTGQANAEFLYDVFGNRRQAIRNGVTTRYVLDPRDMSRVLMETDENGTPLVIYIYGLGLASRYRADGTVHFYHGDNVGNVIAMTDVNGDVTHSYSYDAFGRLLDSVEADDNPFTFVGLHGVMREAAGLYFMRARFYDAQTGRFLGEDPVWSTNLYAYAENNPLRFIDAAGLNSDTPAIDDLAEAYGFAQAILDYSSNAPAYLAEKSAISIAEWRFGEKAELPEMEFSSAESEFLFKISPIRPFVEAVGMAVRSSQPGGKVHEEVDSQPRSTGKRWNEKVAEWLNRSWLGRY